MSSSRAVTHVTNFHHRFFHRLLAIVLLYNPRMIYHLHNLPELPLGPLFRLGTDYLHGICSLVHPDSQPRSELNETVVTRIYGNKIVRRHRRRVSEFLVLSYHIEGRARRIGVPTMQHWLKHTDLWLKPSSASNVLSSVTTQLQSNKLL